MSHYGSLAQLVEQQPFKLMVTGSNPVRPTLNTTNKDKYERCYGYFAYWYG